MSRFRPLLIPAVAMAALATALVAGSGSGLIAKKIVAFLVLPAGLIWWAGFGALFARGLGRKARIGLVAAWILYTLAGSTYLGNALLHLWEKPFFPYEAVAEPLDALVLLGGGTVRTPGGVPAVGLHGDRILRPAALHHEGKVGMLVTTGRSVTERGEDRLLSEETATLWRSLGIPGEAIIEVPEPRNTAEELAAVAKLARENPEWRRIGLCSSASHLPRALKEARGQRLDLVPVPCDFRSQPLAFSPMWLIPQGRGFRDVQTVLWEWLGMRL